MIKVMLSKKLGELRWNQAMLARVTGIRAATIHALYHEDAEQIKFEHLDKICNALECDASEIIVHMPDHKDVPNHNSATTKKV